MKAEAVIASAFVIVFRLVRDVVANHKTTRFRLIGQKVCVKTLITLDIY